MKLEIHQRWYWKSYGCFTQMRKRRTRCSMIAGFDFCVVHGSGMYCVFTPYNVCQASDHYHKLSNYTIYGRHRHAKQTLLILPELKIFLQVVERIDRKRALTTTEKAAHSRSCQVVEPTNGKNLFNIIFVFLKVADRRISPVDLLLLYLGDVMFTSLSEAD